MNLIPFLEAFSWLWDWAKKKPKIEPAKPPLRILVVEDDPNDADLLRHDLGYCGKEATFAENAEAAIALVKRNNIDLIFVDMRLTYMPGWDLLPMIWRHSPHSRVVVICGEMSDLAKIPKPHRMFSVMSKPINADDLCDLFEKLNL